MLEARLQLDGIATAQDVAALRDEIAALRTLIEAGARVEPIAVSAAEAGKLLNLHPDSLVSHGVPCVRVGSARRYRIEALRAWAREREIDAQQQQEAAA